ncbi:MAG: hypothetical protein D6732_17190, partial [Methanobacteriota archaeon]
TDFLKENPIPFYIIPGNHERSNLPASLFLNQPHLHIFHDAKIFIYHAGKFSIYLCGFPFVRHRLHHQWSHIVQQFDSIRDSEGLKLLLMHQAIEGATVGPVNFIFRRSEDVLGQADIPDYFDAVLCGHIHRQQVIFKKRSDGSSMPVIFPGSTERTSFAEKNETKGFFDLTFYREENRWRIVYYFHPLHSRPMVDIPPEETSGMNEDKILTILSRIPEGSIIRFRFPRTRAVSEKSIALLQEIIRQYRDRYIFQFRHP